MFFSFHISFAGPLYDGYIDSEDAELNRKGHLSITQTKGHYKALLGTEE